jgi:two-component system CheB/CheR fusion protein
MTVTASAPGGAPVGGARRSVAALLASAGGVEALRAFFEGLPPSPGACFVVATHHHPGTPTSLTALLRRWTTLEVVDAADGQTLEADRVYVLSGADLVPAGGVLRKRDAGFASGMMQLDRFLLALAADDHVVTAAVILSGAGTDGTIGARAVREAGGFVIAQEPASARHDGMPSSAIAAGVADAVLPPQRIGAWLLERLASPWVEPSIRISSDVIARAISILRDRLGRDFSSYKTTTVARRIERRMMLNGCAEPDDYLRLLEASAPEVEALFKDLLIRVTSFFRDPEVWLRLEELLRDRVGSGPPIRAWVPGCATGEEAYSLAMLLDRATRAIASPTVFQVFATDLDAASIAIARAGWYPRAIEADLDPDQLATYFARDDHGYQFQGALRSSIVFAPHDLLSDPPFTRVDLICCRNVLIYMQPVLQEALLVMFHQSLAAGGLLVLGSSETVGSTADLFEPVDAHARIFRRREGVTRPFDLRPLLARRSDPATAVHRAASAAGVRVGQVVERVLAERYVAPSVLVTARGDIAYVHGRTGPYLQLSAGHPELNAFQMAQPGVTLALTAAVTQALVEPGEVVFPDVTVEVDGETSQIDVRAVRLDEAPCTGLVLVSFERAAHRDAAVGSAVPTDSRVGDLEGALRRSRDELHGLIEQLQASNEQLQSANEELQSTNEELDTSKEEMQSLNEELTTVNADLRHKLEELSGVNDDILNLLDSTQIAIVFLDRDLRIKRFSKPASAVIPMLDTDVGRPLAHLKTALKDDQVAERAAAVLRTLVPDEGTVELRDGHTFLMRIVPYRAANRVIDGVVVTFVDVTELTAAKTLAASRSLALGIVETVREPMLVLDRDLRVLTANRAFYRAFERAADETLGRTLDALEGAPWDSPAFRSRLDGLAAGEDPFEGVEIAVDGGAPIVISGRPLRDVGGRTDLVLVRFDA